METKYDRQNILEPITRKIQRISRESNERSVQKWRRLYNNSNRRIKSQIMIHNLNPNLWVVIFFQHIRECQKYVIQSSHQWITSCVTSYIQSLKEDHREQAEHYAVCASDFLKSLRLTMIINNIANGLNIIKFFVMLYNIYNGWRNWHQNNSKGEG